MERHTDLSPDEVFMDSSNLSSFNTAQFEGRIERPISRNTFTGIISIILLVILVFVGRVWYLQVKNGDVYAAISKDNRLHDVPVFAERGVIFDRNGVRLAWNVPNSEDEDFSYREYAHIPGISHLIGYVSRPAKDSSGIYYQNEFIGKSGVEKSFNDIISGHNGRKIIETNALGEITSEGVVDTPVSGENIRLSIDSRIQGKTYEIIDSLANEVGFSGGAGGIMNIETGELVALTSYPEYDIQAFSDGDSEVINSALVDDRNLLLNRATSGLYTPGSIVKPFLSLAALNENIISPDKQILSTGSITVPNPYFPDKPSVFTDWKEHGWVDMSDALAVSSNVYFYSIGGGYGGQEGLGIARIEKYMSLFGFGKETNIELPPEEVGVIPTPEWKRENFNGEPWRLGDTYNTSIGQYGFQMTLIQALRAVAAIANNGLVFRPSLVSSDGKLSQIETVVDIPREYFNEVRSGMRQAVDDGTVGGLNVSYTTVAGKTGTAEVGILKKSVNSWVVGFFPYDNPKYAFTFLMEKGPGENLVGGVYVARTLFDWMYENTPEYFDLTN
ncbi:MAG: hypothetical protein MRY49_01965 [Candidatus Pacebacteria bacterium]|nr:hypothetical protein [Candidatus Paceibacterota bacterium]